MTINEDQLLALTYITSWLEDDEFQKEAIVNELTNEGLIEELTHISTFLAGALALAVDAKNPTTVKQVIEDLRKILHEDQT